MLAIAGFPTDEAVSQAFLSAIHRVTDDAGASIRGPQWQWPNGHLIDKFLAGRQRSQEWQQYGSVYRIWSCTIPEMYGFFLDALERFFHRLTDVKFETQCYHEARGRTRFPFGFSPTQEVRVEQCRVAFRAVARRLLGFLERYSMGAAPFTSGARFLPQDEYGSPPKYQGGS